MEKVASLPAADTAAGDTAFHKRLMKPLKRPYSSSAQSLPQKVIALALVA
jgi:hypothetical protein